MKEGLRYFLELAKPWIKIELLLPKIKLSPSCDPQNRLKEEAKILSKSIPKESYLIILDERGKALTTKEWAEFLRKVIENNKNIVFLIGGPDGIALELKEKANFLLKLSDFTLNHEIALLLLAEALYRGISIIKGHPYHKE